jgi:hypothetical protein
MSDRVKVRLLFADGGDFRVEKVTIPASSLEGYERLIDCLREDPTVQGELYFDYSRLCSAHLVRGEDD